MAHGIVRVERLVGMRVRLGVGASVVLTAVALAGPAGAVTTIVSAAASAVSFGAVGWFALRPEPEKYEVRRRSAARLPPPMSLGRALFPLVVVICLVGIPVDTLVIWGPHLFSHGTFSQVDGVPAGVALADAAQLSAWRRMEQRYGESLWITDHLTWTR